MSKFYINTDDNNELLRMLSSEPRLHIDARSYLEVYDERHRYAKYLRSYYSYFDELQSRNKAPLLVVPESGSDNNIAGISANDRASPTDATEVVRESLDIAYPTLAAKVPSSSQLSMCGGGSEHKGGGSTLSSKEVISNGTYEADEIIPVELVPKFQQFFDWLDGSELKPEIPSISRKELDEETVLYLETSADRLPYLVHFKDSLLYYDVTCPNNHDSTMLPVTELKPINTGKDGFIYIMRDGLIYMGPKLTSASPRFHHSSFFGGRDVDSSGFMVVEDGALKAIIPHSGHYRPKQDFHILYVLAILLQNNIDLESFNLDTQRIDKRARGVDSENKKTKKVETLHMESALHVYNQLKHKYLFYKRGITSDLFRHIVKDKSENFSKYEYDLDYFSEIESDLSALTPRSCLLMMFNKEKACQLKSDADALEAQRLLSSAEKSPSA